MSVVIAYSIWGVIVAVVLFCVAVAVVAARDSVSRGDRATFEAMEQWEAARNVTGRTSR